MTDLVVNQVTEELLNRKMMKEVIYGDGGDVNMKEIE